MTDSHVDSERQEHQSATSLWRKLVVATGMIALLVSLWCAALIAMLGGRQFMVLTHVDGYRPAEFTVEKLVYFKGRHYASGSNDPTEYWAEGKVDGHRERFVMGSYLPKIPTSQAELESMMDIGRVLPVLYNPQVPDTLDVRVLYPEQNFPANWYRSVDSLYMIGVLPLGILVALCLLFSLLDRSWVGLKFMVVCSFFPVMGLVFAWLDYSA